MVSTNLQQFLQQVVTRIETTANTLFATCAIPTCTLAEAMRYSVLNGGKRLRPALLYALCQAYSGTDANADCPALALELLHCYSLVHDDLPCMDNDDLRRGKPTCHRQFNSESLALLAGDNLQSMAFWCLAQSATTSSTALLMLKHLSHAAMQMAIGQSLDMEAEQNPVNLSQLETIHRLKTGALIGVSLKLGALAAGIDHPDTLEELDKTGSLFGLGYQVQDDILNIIGSEDRLGKRTGSDQKLGKSTYPQLIGLKAAQKLRNELHDQAITLLESMRLTTPLLKELSHFLIFRDC